MKVDIPPQGTTNKINQHMPNDQFLAECNAIDLYVYDLEILHNENERTLKTIIEKIDDSKFHGSASFSDCLNYIQKLAKGE